MKKVVLSAVVAVLISGCASNNQSTSNSPASVTNSSQPAADIDQQEPDLRTADELQKQLAAAGLSNVRVRIQGGRLILYGNVNSEEDKLKAEQLAKTRYPGFELTNMLTVSNRPININKKGAPRKMNHTPLFHFSTLQNEGSSSDHCLDLRKKT